MMRHAGTRADGGPLARGQSQGLQSFGRQVQLVWHDAT